MNMKYMRSSKRLTAIFFLAIAMNTLANGDNVTVDCRHPKPVSRMLFGWHYEEIGMIGDGGLYAEMVRNRNFEESNLPEGLEIVNGKYKDVPNPNQPIKQVYQIDPLVGWVTTPLSNSPLRIGLTDKHPLNEANRHSMLVNVLQDAVEGDWKTAIHNRGYYGMCFRKGVKCRLSLYVRADGYDGHLMVRLSDADGMACSPQLTIRLQGEGWQQYTVELEPERDLTDGMLSLVPTHKGKFQLDMVSMFPSDTWDNGCSVFRADIVQNLKDYHPDFLRFPGGCLVHGVNEETMYHWKKTIGDLASRPGQWGKWEPHYRTDGIGIHEFYELCEYIGADAMYVIPVGMACTEWVHRDSDKVFLHKPTDVNYYIEDALDAIEYAIGPTDSQWGAERARNGHPEPFPLKYVEIGNEDFGPVYYEKYHQIYSALKERYPQLVYIANSPLGDTPQQCIEQFKDKSEVEILDEHYYRGIPWAVANFHRFDSYKRQGIGLYIAELGIQSNGVGGPSGKYPGSILAEGIFKMGLERNGDLNPIMADRPLMRNWECIDRNDMQPLILNSSSVSARTFNYYMCKMLRDNVVDAVYDVKNSEGEQELFVTAGKDNKTRQIVVKIINLANASRKLNLCLNGAKKARKATVTSITATAGQRTTPLHPDAVVPTVNETTLSGSDMTIEVPANSLTIYRINQ